MEQDRDALTYLMSVALEWDCECPSEAQVSNLQKPFVLVDQEVLWLQIPASFRKTAMRVSSDEPPGTWA
jgi:hypothetical protein